MKNIAIIAIMLAVIFLTMGCSIPSQKTDYDNPVVGNDPNAGIRPYNFPMTKWISDHPKMWFEIKQSDDSQGMVKECGYVEEINLEISVYFDCFDGIYIYDKNAVDQKSFKKNYKSDSFPDIKPIMTGTCKFSPDKLTVTINKNSGDSELINYDVITFVREPLEE